MADIFGKTEVLPSWLRDDPSRMTAGFNMGMQAARARQADNQQAIENQRADRRLTLEEDRANLSKMSGQISLEGERLKLDDEKSFLSETPELQRLGKEFQNANTLPELDAILKTSALKTAKGKTVVDRMWDARQVQIAKSDLAKFGSRIAIKKTAAEAALGRPITEDEYRAFATETAFELAPEQSIKTLLPAQIRADSADATAQTRAEAMKAAAAARAISGGLGGAAGVRAREGMDSMVKALEGSGIYVPETFKQDAFQASIRGGMSAANANADTIKAVESENQAFQLIDQSLSEVDAFNAEYGKNAFSEYVGPIDAPFKKANAGMFDPSKLKQADADARQIFRGVNRVVQGYRRGEFGTSLTANETDAFKEIIPANTQADYVEGLRTFRDGGKRRLGVILADHVMDPNIRLPIKVRFLKSNPMFQRDGEDGGAAGGGGKLDTVTAQDFLNKAGGDKAKARQMALDAGYTL
tara:strand:+ start:1903 stop:3315 length:1413 start_codon:yes stop_codon:yes gene_type:complete